MELTPEALAEFWKPLAGLVAIVLGGAWTVFVYFDKRRLSERNTEQESTSQPQSQTTGPRSTTPSGSLTLPLLVLLAGAALLVWAATGDTCELGDVTSEKSWVGCKLVGDVTIN